MTGAAFLERLENVHSRGAGKWSARCPAHPDRNPSLSIGEAGTRILVKCWAGCETSQIVAALGLTMADLFSNSPASAKQQPRPSRQKIDLDDAAFRFELGALDRRLRAERVLVAAANLSIDGLSEQERDRFMNVVADAYEDQNRAEFLESVADGFRMKAFRERMRDHAV